MSTPSVNDDRRRVLWPRKPLIEGFSIFRTPREWKPGESLDYMPNPDTSWGVPPSYKCYAPTDDDIEILAQAFPDSDSLDPSWPNIEARLILAGHKRDELIWLNAPTLIALLGKTLQPLESPTYAPTESEAKINAPNSLDAIEDMGLRQKSKECWVAAMRLRALIDEIKRWTSEWWSDGDTDPGYALRLHWHAEQHIKTLVAHHAKSPSFEGGVETALKHFPQPPSGIMQPPWQEDKAAMLEAFDNANELTELQGELFQLAERIETAPSTAFHLDDVNAPSESDRDIDIEVDSVNGGPTENKVEKPADGPAEPNLFYWHGEEYAIPPRQWRLLNFMWAREKVPLGEVEKQVWDLEVVRTSTVSSTVSKLNKCLESAGCPVYLSVKSGFLTWKNRAED